MRNKESFDSIGRVTELLGQVLITKSVGTVWLICLNLLRQVCSLQLWLEEHVSAQRFTRRNRWGELLLVSLFLQFEILSKELDSSNKYEIYLLIYSGVRSVYAIKGKISKIKSALKWNQNLSFKRLFDLSSVWLAYLVLLTLMNVEKTFHFSLKTLLVQIRLCQKHFKLVSVRKMY